MIRFLLHTVLFIKTDFDEELEIIIKFVMKDQHHMVVLSNIACPSLQGHKSLFCDYFAKTLVDPYKYFRMRFQMSHSLIYIQSMVDTHKPYFVQGIYGSKRFSFSSLQKVIAALMMLTYGVTIDFIDEYLKIGKTTAIKSLKMFVKVLVSFIFIFIF
jgi:hypothetical protein